MGSVQPYKQIAMRTNICRLLVAIALICPVLPLQAYDVSDRFSVNGIVAGTGQCQNVSARLPSASHDDDGSFETFDNTCRGALPLQLEASFTPGNKSREEASVSINTLQVTFVPCRFYETTNSACCQVKRLRFWLRGDYEVYGTT